MISKTAVITGASRGIGKAIAIKFASMGYELYITCHNSSAELFELGEQLKNTYHITCHCYVKDMSDAIQVEELFRGIDRIDVLVNNAGIAYIGLLSEMSISDWHSVIDTNLSAAFYTSRLAIPMMLKKKSGRIINISSVWGNTGASMEVAYSASKGGLNSFTKALAKELGPSNIQVNAIACGIIETHMNSQLSAEELTDICQDIPADRLGRADEVASLVLQLAEAPDYLTGQIITLDGGWI